MRNGAGFREDTALVVDLTDLRIEKEGDLVKRKNLCKPTEVRELGIGVQVVKVCRETGCEKMLER